ncbi:MAG: hypothetical protein A3G34_09540 [Candidatus Lindowbacteria bacterium RIFCSPLOWO2_12_FULL_62_27]|nr:MAG: hypothetical protein A3G34_09540 [Candidatus Lindowbacteria bacterium RIFCSPLOWO2_12_FULL_62_27]
MSVCSVISVDEFERDPRFRKILGDMHALMGVPDHPLGRHCKTGHGRLRRAEIEGGKHFEYPWAVVHGDFQPGMRVLDAGCGRGVLQYYLARMGCRVSGCDLDGFRSRKLLRIHRLLHRLGIAPAPDLTSRLRKNARYFGIEVDYHIEPMQALSWPDAAFDRVYSISVLEHIQPLDEQKRAVEQLARVLKPGGKMILTLDYAEKTAGRESVPGLFQPADVERVIGWSGLRPVEPPVYDSGGWADYLIKLAQFFDVPSGSYSVFTLVLQK